MKSPRPNSIVHFSARPVFKPIFKIGIPLGIPSNKKSSESSEWHTLYMGTFLRVIKMLMPLNLIGLFSIKYCLMSA